MKIITNLLINAVVAYLLTTILSGVHFTDFGSALVFAAVLGILNISLKPVLNILSLPINFITFGLFSLVINGIVMYVTDYFVDGFMIDGFGWALLFSFCLSTLNSILSVFTED